MGENKSITVKLKSNNETIQVYKCKRGTYVNCFDCATEYKRDELIF